MNWSKLLFVLIIVILYIPMVFFGANVFFDKYSGVDVRALGPGKDCYRQYTAADEVPTPEQQSQVSTCLEEQREEYIQIEQERQEYEAKKYVFITLFNLVIILLALFWTGLGDTIMIGLFLGGVLTTFFATMRYFETNSKIGFGVLVVTFFLALFFIGKRKLLFFDWETKKKKKR